MSPISLPGTFGPTPEHHAEHTHPLIFLVVIVSAWVCSFPVSAATIQEGRVVVSIKERLVCRFDDKEMFSLPPLEYRDLAKQIHATWTLADHEDSLTGHRLRFNAIRDGRTHGTLAMTVRGDRITLRWSGTAADAARVRLHIPDATYRSGSGFRYKATSPDGMIREGQINFDVLHPGPDQRNIHHLSISGPSTEAIFDAGVSNGPWSLKDTRRTGTSTDLTFVWASKTHGDPWHCELSVIFSSGENFNPVDLRRVINRGFKDEEDDDGEGDWTDQGRNDLRHLPVGPRHMLGVPSDVIDPQANNAKSATLR